MGRRERRRNRESPGDPLQTRLCDVTHELRALCCISVENRGHRSTISARHPPACGSCPSNRCLRLRVRSTFKESPR
jgi:hypothetical protein